MKRTRTMVGITDNVWLTFAANAKRLGKTQAEYFEILVGEDEV